MTSSSGIGTCKDGPTSQKVMSPIPILARQLKRISMTQEAVRHLLKEGASLHLTIPGMAETAQTAEKHSVGDLAGKQHVSGIGRLTAC